MNRKALLLMIFIIFLCSVSTVFSKGTLLDFDAYETYFGKSKNQVKLIAPTMEEYNGDFYLDAITVAGNNVYLAVTFDENDIVKVVGTLFDSSLLDTADTNNKYTYALLTGTTFIGIDINNLEILNEDNTRTIAALPDGTACMSSTPDEEERFYIVGCYYEELFDKEKNNAFVSGSSNNTNTINTGESIITLVDAQFQGNVLVATFLAENISNHNISYSQFDFSAKDSEYEILDTEWFNCPGSTFNGTITPGDKLKGNVCFKNAVNRPIKITYKPNLFLNNIYIFEVN